MTFEELKARVDELKTRRDQALGAIKNIEDGWEQKYGTRDVNEIKSRLKSMRKELDDMTKEFNDKVAEAESILAGA